VSAVPDEAVEAFRRAAGFATDADLALVPNRAIVAGLEAAAHLLAVPYMRHAADRIPDAPVGGTGTWLDAEADRLEAGMVICHCDGAWHFRGISRCIHRDEPLPEHRYVSTACQHGRHDQCRRTCKFCDAACGCGGCEHQGEAPDVLTRQGMPVAAILSWAADEIDAQAAAHGVNEPQMIDLTDHIRCFADQPRRGSLVPWPEGVRRPGKPRSAP
jgi:hypothetical protein